MINNKELNEVSLSPTKKDYYQIYNELLDLASKISDRWSPESTNESDPGIVLLKALTAIADKLNYNIDKNTLEAFMPSATQVESMRKLTEMMGYPMKHYIAATCDANISYNPQDKSKLDNYRIYFPKYVNLKDVDEEINYVTLEEFTLTNLEPLRQIPVIEGTLVECETNSDNIISMVHLDDNNRYYLPEYNIAENGIFINNVYEVNGTVRESDSWQKVMNLNSQLPKAKVFKFGVSTADNLPYIQFPDDISQIIGDGIRIKYIRTNGVNGNIKANTLSKLEVPAIWSSADDTNISSLTSDDFLITNVNATKNGADPESINAAYNNFKKTTGTFDTLVTCRDYMNKIYQLTKSDTDTTPLVSNAIVSDIRDDINNSYCLCSFNDYGICYSNKAFKRTIDGVDSTINNFDLILYPFKTLYNLNTKSEYENTFKYSGENFQRILVDIENNKTIAHNIMLPKSDDIFCIKNYIQLKANITTVKRVTYTEEADILENIKTAIYKNFNNRMLDFGEEIPEDTIKEVIKTADPRIKDISNFSAPVALTKFMLTNNEEDEYDLASLASDSAEASVNLKRLYNKLVLRNVLAGRIAAFSYDTEFATSYLEKKYTYNKDPETGNNTESYENVYGNDKQISKIISEFRLNPHNLGENGFKLRKNEVIQFRTPNFRTKVTYPAYVNYFLHLAESAASIADSAIPATFMSLSDFFATKNSDGIYWGEVIVNENHDLLTALNPVTQENFISRQNTYGAMFYKETTTVDNISTDRYIYTSTWIDDTKKYYYIVLNNNTFASLHSRIARIKETCKVSETTTAEVTLGLYRSLGFLATRNIGKYIDINKVKYMQADVMKSNSILNYYVPILHKDGTVINKDKDQAEWYTYDGLGKDLKYNEVMKNAEYQLKKGEYLLINYTDSKTSEDSNQEQKQVINKVYEEGAIIKANFPIIDSDIYHSNHSFSKKDGFNFENYSPAGMFTLGTDEQICIREPAAISLYDGTTKDDGSIYYLYFIRNDDNTENDLTYFKFDSNSNSYTLKENEYIFFTDKAKQNLGYYGNGTTITIIGIDKNELIPNSQDRKIDRQIRKNNRLGVATYQAIIESGIDAIPWGPSYHFTKDFNLTFIENQYISLTEGDTIKRLDIGTDSLGNTEIEVDQSNADVIYEIAEKGTEETLPKISIDGYKWYVRTRLDFNMGPDIEQPLNSGDSFTIVYADGSDPDVLKPLSDGSYIYVKTTDTQKQPDTTYYTYNTETKTYVKFAGNAFENGVIYYEKTSTRKVYPLSVFSNYYCQIAHHEFEPIAVQNNSNNKAVSGGIKLKLADLSAPAESESNISLMLNNYKTDNARYTKVDFKQDINYDDSNKAFALNISIPEADIGLIMFYYIDENYTEATAAKLKVLGSNGADIRRYNYGAASGDAITEYKLVPGIQVIRLNHQVTGLEVYADTAKNGTIIFGELSLVKGINENLKYQALQNESTALDTLLADIKSTVQTTKNNIIEDQFYYNMPIDNNRAINLNPLLEENLLSAEAWYDSNNENNKFVVTEIDAGHLDKGITLTKASRII